MKKSMTKEMKSSRTMAQRVFRAFGMSLLLVCGLSFMTGCFLFKSRRGRSSSSQRRAAKKKARKAASIAALKTFPTWLSNKSCEGAGKTYLKTYSRHVKTEGRNKAAIKLARCGDWKTVFERLFTTNRGWALSMLRALESAEMPVPIHKGMEKWITESSQPFGFKMGFYVADFMRYAIDKSPKKKNYCKAYYLSAQKAPKIRNSRIRSKVRRYGLGFMMVGGCKQYKRFVVSQLQSNWWIDRKIACDVLGQWGAGSALRKVSLLSRSDGFIHRGASRRMRRPIYSVRIACRAAAGKIRMSR